MEWFKLGKIFFSLTWKQCSLKCPVLLHRVTGTFSPRLRQEDCCEAEASLSYIMTLRSTWKEQQDLVSKINKQTNKRMNKISTVFLRLSRLPPSMENFRALLKVNGVVNRPMFRRPEGPEALFCPLLLGPFQPRYPNYQCFTPGWQSVSQAQMLLGHPKQWLYWCEHFFNYKAIVPFYLNFVSVPLLDSFTLVGSIPG